MSTHSLQFLYLKKLKHPKLSQICSYGIFSKGLKKDFKTAVVNEASVFEPLKVNCIYRKNSKNWDTLNYYRDCPTNGIVGFYSAILRSKDAGRITNRVDTDQTAP